MEGMNPASDPGGGNSGAPSSTDGGRDDRGNELVEGWYDRCSGEILPSRSGEHGVLIVSLLRLLRGITKRVIFLGFLAAFVGVGALLSVATASSSKLSTWSIELLPGSLAAQSSTLDRDLTMAEERPDEAPV